MPKKMSSSAWKLHQQLVAKASPSAIYLLGENAYVTRELELAYRHLGFELVKETLGAQGPSPEWESHAASMGLFADKKVIWSTISSNPSKWSRAGIQRLESLQRNLDPESLILILQCTNKKIKVKTDDMGLEEFSLETSLKEKVFWLKHMVESEKLTLSNESMQFLLSFDFDLLQLSQYVKLWSLGGDFWAQRALGWDPEKTKSSSPLRIDEDSRFTSQPAFQWVDAVVEGNKSKALSLLTELKEDGQEVIQLFALLAKSLRILSMIQNNASLEGQAPFLVKKLKRQRIGIDVDRALRNWVETDYKFKSSGQDSFALAEKFICANSI